MHENPMSRSFRLFNALGFDTNIVFARSLKTDSFIETEISHCQFDGISGFVHVLQENNIFEKNGFPPVPHRHQTNFIHRFLNRIYQYLRCLYQFQKVSRGWKPERLQLSASNDFKYSWRSLTIEQTADLRKSARANGVSLNTYLLWKLNQAVLPHLLADSNPCTWIVPVSLYKTVNQAIGPGNLTSIMEINLNDSDTFSDLQNQIQREVAREAYWGPWLATLINNILPDWVISFLLAKTVAQKKRVGTFTNLGKWISSIAADSESWTVVPPVHPGQPIGVGVIEFNNKLSFGIKCDSVLKVEISEIYDAWLKQ